MTPMEAEIDPRNHTKQLEPKLCFVLFRVSSWIVLLPHHHLAAFTEHCQSTFQQPVKV
jgi:hypothetical protein